MGNWPGSLCTTDPETNVSREITDEEIQDSDATAGGDLEDPDKRWLIRKISHEPDSIFDHSRR